MICPRCGKTTVPGAAYCGECGNKLASQPQTAFQNMIKRGEHEADMAARSAGEGLQSVIDDIVHFFTK